MRAPPITIRCECGEIRDLSYGERWICERCGRRWNTAQIPAEEYWGLLRDMRRLRLSVIAVAVALALAFGLVAMVVSASVVLLLPVAIAAWFLCYMPWWRRKVRRQARSLPKWELHPE